MHVAPPLSGGPAQGGPGEKKKCHKTITSLTNVMEFLGTREVHEPPGWDSGELLSICIRMTRGKHGELPRKS